MRYLSQENHALTFRGAFEDNVELLHIVVDQCHLIVAHHELHHVRLNPPLRATHRVSPIEGQSDVSKRRDQRTFVGLAGIGAKGGGIGGDLAFS